VIQESREGQVVKGLYNLLPGIKIAILPLHLIIEAINPGQRRRLMIAPKHDNLPRIEALIGKQEGNSLYRVIAPINIVAQEDDRLALELSINLKY